MKKLYIETLGCQMNKSDSERIAGILSHFGYVETEVEKDADLLIINTCSIRQLSADKAYSKLGVWGKWKKSRPELKIAICGCVAQQDKEKVRVRAPYVDLVFGTHNIYQLPELIKKIENNEKVCAITNNPVVCNQNDFKILRKQDSVNAWIPIIEGCNNFCTYCVVPFTRGRERSRHPEEIIQEAKNIIKEGFKEITLLGQNVDSYGKDLKDKNITLANLLRDLNKLDGEFRIRFVTSYPSDITDDLINAVDECDKVCKYFHIPMQSGNSHILAEMNRHYSKEQYYEIVSKIRNRFPDVAITSDFIAGFPGETEEEFQDTLDAIDELELDYSNTAAYSPRVFTKAGKMVDKFIPEDVKYERLERLNEKNREVCLKSNEKFVGKVLNVLVEGKTEKDGVIVLNSRAGNNKIVHFVDDKKNIGDFVNVKITKAQTWCLYGESV
ncbi:TPA: tRNA (N6-isopentenyl adenosine(37)-C2)-methylthiotransferase MiaB [Candidatus Avigastranaerophilus faecigallinarum]|nr:tRNA (N6-isopentenyl adenosine(37)-C2)-methylthiotransferase MiaB [Candidatus Avigastranaerophilus faecigallinarum]